jgi:carboxylesterase type B
MYIDEFNSLNLQMTLPKGTTPMHKLPVFVYIHGGAFVRGTGNYSILDRQGLTQIGGDKRNGPF